MKTIFDPEVRQELIKRIDQLTDNNTRQWGKMNVYQMAKHCVIWNEWILGTHNPVYKQMLLGKIFGKMALKSNTRNEKPLPKNTPAGSAFTVKEKEGDLSIRINSWKNLINDYEHYSNEPFIHDFFGKMTREEIGIFSYKHNDHHLRQFGV